MTALNILSTLFHFADTHTHTQKGGIFLFAKFEKFSSSTSA